MTTPIVARTAAILAAAGLLLIAADAHAQTVRDHRGENRKYEPRPTGGTPVVRDHRKPLFCFAGPFDPGSGTCYQTPYTPRPR